jgi:hypothetical protein
MKIQDGGIILIIDKKSDYKYLKALEADLQHAGLSEIKVWKIELAQ